MATFSACARPKEVANEAGLLHNHKHYGGADSFTREARPPGARALALWRPVSEAAIVVVPPARGRCAYNKSLKPTP